MSVVQFEDVLCICCGMENLELEDFLITEYLENPIQKKGMLRDVGMDAKRIHRIRPTNHDTVYGIRYRNLSIPKKV